MRKISLGSRVSAGPTYALAVMLGICAYTLFYFGILGLDVAGVATFRIDYHVLSSRRGDEIEDLAWAITYTRPVTGLYVVLQGWLVNNFAEDSKYFAYILQHAALFVGFFSTARALESVFRIRLGVVILMSAWITFAVTPAVMEGVYKLETVVGTLTMLFGGLSILFLVQWQKDKRRWLAAGFLLFYALSIFSKEDFILAPMFLLAWYMFRDGNRQGSPKQYLQLLLPAMAIVVTFILFNKFITLSDRSFITPVDHQLSPYFMTFNPISMVRTAIHYSFGFDSSIKYIFIAYVTSSFLAVVFGRAWKEVLLVGLIVGSLMGPYLIMPNHLFAYYGLKWMMWQVLTTAVIIRLFIANRRVADSVVVFLGAASVLPAIIGFHNQNNSLWHVSKYFKNEFEVSRNVHETLAQNRKALNALDRVAVIGVGPGQIVNSPWQGNGETAFYFEDLGLTPKWEVYVKSSRSDYAIDSPASLSAIPKPVVVKELSKLPSTDVSHVLVFENTGHGTLIRLDGMDRVTLMEDASGITSFNVRLSSPELKISASPETISTCAQEPEVVEIKWDVSSKASGHPVKIWVVDAAGTRKLWLQGPAAGAAKTGQWVTNGFKFQVEHAVSQKILASITIGGSACP